MRRNGKSFVTINQAHPVPTTHEIIATVLIMINEFDKYLGKLVANKCGQIFSTGKKAIQTTVIIGNRTSADIKIANMPHLSQVNICLRSIFFRSKFLSMFYRITYGQLHV
jgi:hypothetical protein